MAAEVILRLDLLDVYGKSLGETVDVMLRSQVLSEIHRFSVKGARTDLKGLHGAPQGRYRIDIDPPSYQFVSQFINLKASGITSKSFTFPVDPNKVTKVNFQA